MSAGRATVALRLPRGWIELDPNAVDLVTELRAEVRRGWSADLSDERLSTLIVPIAVELRRLAAQTELVTAGIYAHVVPIEGAEYPFVTTASMIVALSPPVSGLDEVRAGIRATHLDLTVDTVELPGGPAVRARGLTEIRDRDWPEAVPARLCRYFVPTPGATRVAVLSFVTPNLELADSFDEIFEFVAATLRFDRVEVEPAAADQGY